jgi:hypothetical protein
MYSEVPVELPVGELDEKLSAVEFGLLEMRDPVRPRDEPSRFVKNMLWLRIR